MAARSWAGGYAALALLALAVLCLTGGAAGEPAQTCGTRKAKWQPFGDESAPNPNVIDLTVGPSNRLPGRSLDRIAHAARRAQLAQTQRAGAGPVRAPGGEWRRRLLSDRVSMRGLPPGLGRVMGGWFPDQRQRGVFQTTCNREKNVKKEFRTEGERMLAQCIRAGAKCRHPPGEVMAAARGLPGIKKWILERPKCLVVNRAKGGCARTTGNRETGTAWLGQKWIQMSKPLWGREKFRARGNDLTLKMHDTCAIVGNGPALQKSAKGDTIDRYDAVWRFNMLQNRDPLKTRNFNKFAGKKTSYRIFSRAPSYKVMSGEVRIRPSGGEKWMFWHAHSMLFLPGMSNKKMINYESLLMYSPDVINWMMAGYFQLRRDLSRLGLGPWSCPRNINSGLHGILMAQLLCKKTATFGISHIESLVYQGHLNDRGHRMTWKHSWAFDTIVLRVLRYAGHLDVCSG